MQKITPFLWFDNQLEEAIEFYTSIFRNARIRDVKRQPDGKALVARFQLEGQEFIGLNGGPDCTFNEAISLFVQCADQPEIDYYWDRLLEGGKELQCGWLKDRYGLAWQIHPETVMDYLNDPDPEKASRVFNAVMKMVKIDAAELDRAYEG
ncbi:MAG: VOC family protein [Shinella sp.]|nr:VOC family protein [Shinella sp.]